MHRRPPSSPLALVRRATRAAAGLDVPGWIAATRSPRHPRKGWVMQGRDRREHERVFEPREYDRATRLPGVPAQDGQPLEGEEPCTARTDGGEATEQVEGQLTIYDAL